MVPEEYVEDDPEEERVVVAEESPEPLSEADDPEADEDPLLAEEPDSVDPEAEFDEEPGVKPTTLSIVPSISVAKAEGVR